ncbi:helix-turn-helix domain-containing protein [Janibacter hoylei]|uniref:helix-turn-helix domain-containing protein n=1 Tax=Janibacter hoylei TaxID=364298 RepID=UPI002237113D|nr:helix-turn-helix domain-containing protein [Janibacter hoylei]MCW4602565.1 helix-turn-helix domain-containing protein [Janibacter hoylei]
MPDLVRGVSAELGLPEVPIEHEWPVDIVAVAREFVTCVATDDPDRLGEPGGILERLGAEAARGEIGFKTLARSIRVSVRRFQSQVHRIVLYRGLDHDHEAVVELLERILEAGELSVTACLAGFKNAGLGRDGPTEDLRRVASALIRGGGRTSELAEQMGWRPDTHVCVIVSAPEDVPTIQQAAGERLAFFPRSDSVVLVHPGRREQLATSLRPQLADCACAVGPAVPLAEVPGSLSLTLRLRRMAIAHRLPVFVDDYLLELACSADPVVVAALRRKHFVELDLLGVEQREALVATLREWILQWGHRPGIAKALHVHPQTVSGRINRLKDLLANDLDPAARAELLVLLMAGAP